MKLFGNQNSISANTKFAFALCTVLALGASPSRADDTKQKDQGSPTGDSTTAAGKSSQVSRSDEKFVMEAAKSGKMEVEMGKLGLQKSQSAQVKQFSQKLIDDHTKANTELKQIALSKGITLPESSPSVTGTAQDTDRTQVRDKDHSLGAHGEHLQKLGSLSGAAFDREFVKMGVKHHEKDVKDFEKASQKLDDTSLRAFAAKTLPTLREHLTQVRNLETQAGNAGAPGTQSGTQSDKDAGNQNDKNDAGNGGNKVNPSEVK